MIDDKWSTEYSSNNALTLADDLVPSDEHSGTEISCYNENIIILSINSRQHVTMIP